MPRNYISITKKRLKEEEKHIYVKYWIETSLEKPNYILAIHRKKGIGYVTTKEPGHTASEIIFNTIHKKDIFTQTKGYLKDQIKRVKHRGNPKIIINPKSLESELLK